MIVFPNAKINLGLHILNKRPDGYHNLETVFYPVHLNDILEIVSQTEEPISEEELLFSTTGIQIEGDAQENLCIKAFELLKKDYPLPSIKMHLHKAIPTGAGLGGGSADASFTLSLLNNKFNLGITNEVLSRYALKLGSDCPFFIYNKPCFATGRGELLKALSLNLSAFSIVLINPGITINTSWAFSQLNLKERNISRKSLHEIIQQPVNTWKRELENDFEEPVFNKFSELKKIKDQLYDSGAIYASLSGSGATLFGIFNKEISPVLSFSENYYVKILNG